MGNVFSKTYIFKIGCLRCKFSAIRLLNPIVLSYVGLEQCLFPPVVEVLGRTVRCEQEYPVSGCFIGTPNLACTNMRYVILGFTKLRTQVPYQRSIKITSVIGRDNNHWIWTNFLLYCSCFSVEPSDLVSEDQTDAIALSRAMLFQIFPDAFLNTAGVYLYFICKTFSN